MNETFLSLSWPHVCAPVPRPLSVVQSNTRTPGEPLQGGQATQQQGQRLGEEGSIQRRLAGQKGKGGKLRGHHTSGRETGMGQRTTKRCYHTTLTLVSVNVLIIDLI